MATLSKRAECRSLGFCGNSRYAIAWILLALLVCVSGCRGCSKTPEQIEKDKLEAEEKAKKKKKEEEIKPFEAGMPHSLPANNFTPGSCKPGHWISQAWPDVKANLGDFQGELKTEVVDRQNLKVPLIGVPYEITNERPAALAKQQQKSLDAMTWIPPADEKHRGQSVNFKLATPGGGSVAIEQSMSLSAMHSYQYFFVVLSKGGRFDYLDKRLDSFRLHRAHADSDSRSKFYEVVTMPANRRPGLPPYALCWTSIAYLLWDESDPALWDLDQQQGLIDWLHWGGQIIVSGPDALVQLQTSFLRPYLPATVEKSRTFAAEDLQPLQYWAGENGLPPRATKPWPGAVLKKDAQAEDLPETGDNMVIERRVGRGRIVATAFRITGADFTGWSGCDCFFNACLLRRPAREFSMDPTAEEVRVSWVTNKKKTGEANNEMGAGTTLADAAKNTAVRYFVRDTAVKWNDYAADVTPNGNLATTDDTSSISEVDPLNPMSDEMKSAPGLGAWNDFGLVANRARMALDDATGIKVLERDTIIWIIVGYLCVLVPANWLFFRLIGRVEWAWIAAPLIAIGCTIVVVHKAQLNIGFARSQNEIAVIEMQPGYSRAHVARYTALYTSLATGYEFHLIEAGGQILPFARDSDPQSFHLSYDQSLREVVCRRGDDTQLTGFEVKSNDDDFIHCEEMADFGGVVSLHKDTDGSLRVTNGTKHPLENCQVVRKNETGGVKLAQVAQLDSGATARLKFDREPVAMNESFSAKESSGLLKVDDIANVALTRQDLRPGEVCLVARVADNVPGLTVVPAAQQTRQAALLVAHLDSGKLPEPEVDERVRASSSPGDSSKAESDDEIQDPRLRPKDL